MKSKFTLFVFLFILNLPFSILAQSYEVIGSFKGKASQLVSFSYNEEEEKISGYNYYSEKKCEVFMKEGGRVEKYEKQEEEKEYKLIDRAFLSKNGKFNKTIFLFKNEDKENVLFLSDTSIYENSNSWNIDIFEYPEVKEKILRENMRANVASLSDSLFILSVANRKEEQDKMYNFVIDFTTKKIVDYFTIEAKNSSEFYQILFSFAYSNDYITYEKYDYQLLEQSELKERGISTKNSLKVGKNATSYFVRKSKTEQVTEYKIDQSDYFVGSIQNELLEDGSIELTGLYSQTPQIRKGTLNLVGSYMTDLCNDAEGIFKQTFKDGKKIKDIKIKIEKEILKKIEPFKEIGFASLNWKQGKDKTLFVINVFSSYSPILQNTHVVVGICIDKGNNIISTESMRIEAGEFGQFLQFDTYKKLDTTDQEKVPYIHTVTNKQKITAYKIVCGKIYKKSYKIPETVEGYQLYALEEYVGKDDNIYALYNNKKEFKLVKLKTSQLIEAIIEE